MTLGYTKSDNINGMITISVDFHLEISSKRDIEIWSHQVANNINQLY